jgi:hypothetical protein
MNMLSNTPPPRDSAALWKHFSDTYFSLRAGLAALGFAMPFALYLYGKLFHGLDLQASMSAYFWAAGPDQCASFPVRTVFVGFLFAIGVFLFAYKGLTPLENTLLNFAAVCAALVAIFPERLSLAEAASDPQVAQLFENCPAVKAWAAQPSWPVHYAAAVLLFVLLAVVVWFCAEKSLEYLPVDRDAAAFRRAYRAIAVAMILFPAPGLAVAFLLGAPADKVFFVEAAGILTFGVYWSVKSFELHLSSLESDPGRALEHAARRKAGEARTSEHGGSR